MTSVIVDISVSLDGYVTAAHPGIEHGLGVGGECLHAWASSAATPEDVELIEAGVASTGAVLMGRKTFDFVDGPHGWSGDLGYGAERDQSAPPPNFVVTHAVPSTVRLSERFTFVTDGIQSALEQARASAGTKDVVIMGGADIALQYLQSGLVDVLSIHLAPTILGAGTRLFTEGQAIPMGLELMQSVTTPAAQHLTYRLK
ncbi:dihydrofolate reductase family protein [Homoserinimonas sp. A447]